MAKIACRAQANFDSRSVSRDFDSFADSYVSKLTPQTTYLNNEQWKDRRTMKRQKVACPRLIYNKSINDAVLIRVRQTSSRTKNSSV